MLAALALLPAAFQDPAAKPAPDTALKLGPEALGKLAWLSGTWVMQEGEKTTEEHWRPLQGTTLLGTSHLYDKQRTRFFEFLRITAKDGTIAYVAQPGGVPPTVFVATRLDDGAVEFANGKHDFPQRIRYEKTGKGVTATISLLDGSKAQAFVFEKK
jgi:hypothetical protein